MASALTESPTEAAGPAESPPWTPSVETDSPQADPVQVESVQAGSASSGCTAIDNEPAAQERADDSAADPAQPEPHAPAELAPPEPRVFAELVEPEPHVSDELGRPKESAGAAAEPSAPVTESAAEEQPAASDVVVVLDRNLAPDASGPSSATDSGPVKPASAQGEPDEKPTVQTPAVEEPVVPTPAVEEPTARVPAVQEPTARVPAVDEPTAQVPAVQVPDAGQSAARSRPRPGPHRAKAPARARRRWRSMMAGITALAVVLITGGTVAFVLSSRNSVVSSSDNKGAANALVVERARIVDDVATWVAGQVSHHASVSCEQAMCDALAQHGFPTSSLRMIARKSPRLPKSEIVVATSVVEQQFGKQLDKKLAPVVLARFGKAGELTTIRSVAPHGAKAYLNALRVDFKLRQTVGTGLITSRQIAASPAARKMMESGAVDSRLLIVITALAAQHPIDILTFGTAAPGASPGVPLRVAELAESTAGVNLTEPEYLQAMKVMLRAQPPRYRPASISTVRTTTGEKVLRIEFPAPSPLGLLNPTQ
ncbi:MAG TPA: hypothetical protein VN767_06090 [Streptosporangiaceae bacterium]|nr:hypothetical protein [Streptosporangiaceae bacterium]